MSNRTAARLIPLLLFCALPWRAPHLSALEPEANHLGLEVCFALRPFGFDDPYSGSLGGGVFYERHHLFGALPFFLGAQLDGYGFYPLRPQVGDSTMLQAGLYLGADFPIPVERRFSLSLAPYLGWRHYWRWMRFDGGSVFTARPLLTGGVLLYLHAGRRALLGASVEADLILDREPLGTLLHGQRFGVRF